MKVLNDFDFATESKKVARPKQVVAVKKKPKSEKEWVLPAFKPALPKELRTPITPTLPPAEPGTLVVFFSMWKREVWLFHNREKIRVLDLNKARVFAKKNGYTAIRVRSV
jgi:hypothetical protein